MDYIIRTYREGDESALAKLHNLAFSSHRPYFYAISTPKLWRWFFKQRPLFDPEGILIAESEGKIVGSVNVNFREFKVGKDILLAGTMDDGVVRPEARGRGIYTRLISEAMEYQKEKGVDLTIGYVAEGSGPYRVLSRLGFNMKGRITVLARVLHSTSIISRQLGIYNLILPASALISLLRETSTRTPNYCGMLHEENPDEDLIDFINSSCSDLVGFTPRKPDYWRWRHVLRPSYDPADWIVLRERGQIVACITASRRRVGFKLSHFADFGVLDDVCLGHRNARKRGMGIFMIQQAVNKFANKGADVALASVCRNNVEVLKLFRVMGFLPIRRTVRAVKGLGSDFDMERYVSKAWYLAQESHFPRI